MQVGMSISSIPGFLEEVEKALKGKKSVNITVTQAKHEEPNFFNEKTAGFTKGIITYIINEEE